MDHEPTPEGAAEVVDEQGNETSIVSPKHRPETHDYEKVSERESTSPIGWVGQ